jgi:3-hydroxyacyl-CoA dehydrogenase
MNRFNVRKVAVLGAGVMGAQIAAHLVNVKVPVVLFDLPAKEGPKNGIVTKAIDGLKKLKPAPFGAGDRPGLVEPANYNDGLGKLAGCDLVIEAIAEQWYVEATDSGKTVWCALVSGSADELSGHHLVA